MIFQKISVGVLTLMLTLALPSTTWAQDIEASKKKLGTSSTEAVALFHKSQELFRQEKYSQGIENLKRAMDADPEFQLGMYWLALFYGKKGDAQSEYEYYEKLYQSHTTEISSIVVDGCVNAGIGKAQGGKPEDAEKWFGRALMLDPDDTYQCAWKVYRNLAISKINNKQPLSAAVCASIGHKFDEEQVPQGMIDQFFKSAAGDVASIAKFETEANDFEYLGALPEPGKTQNISAISEPVAQLVDLNTFNLMLAIPKDGKYVDIIDYNDSLNVKRIKLQGRPQAGVFVDGRVFLSVTSPNRLIEFDHETGKEIQRWELKQTAPKSIAVAPKHQLAFMVQGDGLRILNLETGKETLSPYSVSEIACDPNQEFVYAFYRPPYKSETERGYLLIDGRPIHFQIDSGKVDWSQSTLFRFKIAKGKSDGSLILSQVRLNAASNAQQLTVSADGSVLGIVGGGGWRPSVENSNAGYGVLFLDANDFERVLRFVPTDAYPKSAAVSPVDHLILAHGGKTVLTHAVNDDATLLKFEEEKSPHSFAFSSDSKWLFQVFDNKLSAVPLQISGED